MIQRLLKRKSPTTSPPPNPSAGFSLGFRSDTGIDQRIDEIVREATQTETTRENEFPQMISPQPLTHENESTSIPSTVPIPSHLLVKKTLSKSKTLSGLSNPLKVPSYLQKPSLKVAPASSPPKRVVISTLLGNEPSPSSFKVPSTSVSIDQVRLSLGKEILKTAASCQMISIQEAHSMGGKLTLPSQGFILPIIAELLHRSKESVQKTLLHKINKSPTPFDYFKSFVGNQSVQRFHSLLQPYGIIPIFYRGRSLTVLVEHPMVLPLVESILQEKDPSISWIHPISIEIQSLENIP